MLEHTSDYKPYPYGLDGCYAWKVIPIVLNEKPYQPKKVPTLSARDWHTATTYPRRGTEQQQDRHGLHPWGAPITPGHNPLYFPLCVHHGGDPAIRVTQPVLSPGRATYGSIYLCSG